MVAESPGDLRFVGGGKPKSRLALHGKGKKG